MTSSAVFAVILAAIASIPGHIHAQDKLGSVNDYLNTRQDFPDADELLSIGLAVVNGAGTLKNGIRFEGAEIVGVFPGSPGAIAGLKGRQEHIKAVMTAGILAASMVFPPAMLGMAVLSSSEIGESHEFIIAVDGTRTRDVVELEEALDQAQPGEIVYMTIVSGEQRKQVRLRLPGAPGSAPDSGSGRNQ